MKPKTNRLLTLLMAVIMIMAFSIFVNADMELADDYTGKTVILSSNDVHGAVDGYAYMKALEKEFTARGADVITVDAGDYSQGTTYVSESKGLSAIQLMNLAGYDYATLGNHEFDFGPNIVLRNVEEAEFKVLCADILNKVDNAPTFVPSDIYEDEDSGLKIGFFGMATPETQTKSIPTNFENIKFPSKDDFYQIAQDTVDQLKNDGADVIVCLAHLGVDAESEPYRSTDMMAAVDGIDMMLDGHSHTVMTVGEGGKAIMSTGTKFTNIGVTIIDEKNKMIEDNDLYHLRDKDGDPYTEALVPDDDVKTISDKIIAEVDAAYGAKIAESKVELNGAKSLSNGVYGNRDGETNSGDLITDAIKWYVMKDGADLGVPANHVVTITNGGGIRAAIHAGDVSKNDILTVLPFGNTIAAVTVKGSELLEALEASTFGTPATAVGGFPQIEGMKITIRAYNDYDRQPETYPDSTYYGPASINRVTIDSVNGEAFDPEAEYVVLTNNFCSAGGDTYYAFKAASSQFDTGIPMDYAVVEYVIDHLDRVIDETYAEPQGRITIYATKAEEVADEINSIPDDVSAADADAINSAKEFYDSLTDEEKAALPAGTKEKLEAAEAKLEAAAAKDEAAAAKDKTESLSKLATEMIAAAASGVSANTYTKDSYKSYMDALEAAKAVLNKADAAKEDFDAATEALVKAKDALKKKGAQPMTAAGKTVSLKASKVKKKSAKVAAAKAITVKNNAGSVTYAKAKGNKKITVASNGKITVKKGLKKGTYKVNITVTAKGNDNYLAGSKTVTVTVKIKK
ncbi:MAG: 5'-nucleotidase C-terminal domain-containing protein [Mogibacterium sp.]|nr:5'-nucleotidase C-terminal domain-containing protein [Mogibacterium sp.]